MKIEISLAQMPAITLQYQETELDTMELQLKVIKSKFFEKPRLFFSQIHVEFKY